MRRQRRGSVIHLTAALGAVALTGACAHNDVLVFGTSTTIGLNVETASTNGAAPSIVLGYEREEAVWMPLLANGRDSNISPCTSNDRTVCTPSGYPLEDAMYQSTIRDPSGQRVVQTDSYSVFASLGANFNGRASGANGVESGGGLAQFFATGNAAVNISQNEALVTALKVGSPASSQAQANAVAAAASNGTQTSAFAGLSAPQIADINATAERERNQQLRRVDLVVSCAMAADGTFRWPAIVDGLSATDYPATAKANLKTITTREALRSRLETNSFLTTDALTVATAAPLNCPGA